MGRGLSPLQKWILTTAAGQPAKYGTDHLHFAEIMVGWYGWHTTTWGSQGLWREEKRTRAERIATHRRVAAWLKRDPDDHKYGDGPPDEIITEWHFDLYRPHFDVWEIGEKAYSVATSTVSRSVKRLEARGLVNVERHKWLALTAASLSVESAACGPLSQPIEPANGLSVESDAHWQHRQPIDVVWIGRAS